MYKLAIIIPFFKSIECSIEQSFIDEFSIMSDDVLKNIQVIFVDDCSPIPLKIIIKNIKLHLKCYRIETGILWNVGGAKNLGAFNSDAEKLLFLDADHKISEKTIRTLIDYNIRENEYIIFMRGKIKAPGIFCTSKERFLQLNGFDEAFSGHYGSEDKNFSHRHGYNGGVFTELEDVIGVRENYYHHSLDRDSAYNKKIVDTVNHSGLFLNFKWRCVWAECYE